MTTTSLHHLTQEVIESYGNTAHNLISAYRSGGERVIRQLNQRWNRAFDQSKPKLSVEVQKNAQATRRKLQQLAEKGLGTVTGRADLLVNKVVSLASSGSQRVAQQTRLWENNTGVKSFSLAAQANLSTARWVSRFAHTLERQSVVLANKAAGEQATIKLAAAKRVSAFKKARAAK